MVSVGVTAIIAVVEELVIVLVNVIDARVEHVFDWFELIIIPYCFEHACDVPVFIL